MSTDIKVDKKSVAELLSNGAKSKFIIPDYQRPYAWSKDEVEQLWEDITEYIDQESESTYFLGTVVYFLNDEGDEEIIDGQQRITTLFLLVRAMYTKLESMQQDQTVDNLKHKIEPLIWETNRLSGQPDKKKILIYSNVINDQGNREFAYILETGKIKAGAKSLYDQNYKTFQKLIDLYAEENPLRFEQLIVQLLDEIIVLPIEADSQDTALTIFNTLNDRGLALSDADIFKAKIYHHLKNTQEKNQFIESWQKLEQRCQESKISIQELFYYYMFYLRGKQGDKKVTTPGLRKYFAVNKFEKLFKKPLMKDLNDSLDLWSVINTRAKIDKDWGDNFEILKVLDVLSSFPNEFWKYPVNTYYLKYHRDTDFQELFVNFLNQLAAGLIGRFIVLPTVNAIKAGIVALNANIFLTNKPIYNPEVDEEVLADKAKNPHYRIVPSILKFLAYQDNRQKELLPEHWEIEHILPKKWQQNNLFGFDKQAVEPFLDHIGNKLPFEKSLNISAGNGYFKVKKEKYLESNIAITREFSTLQQQPEWTPDDIKNRDGQISQLFMNYLQHWIANTSGVQQISEEDKTRINAWKKLTPMEYENLSDSQKEKYKKYFKEGYFEESDPA
ncbi:DUF262 domain-containing HNH endonuclease family protein [Pediococcus inopinatus]|uniref:DUF262 domain-containing protein n=1 Tax=Pediococcus inopinatus TaxID=114090 RepID=UPI002B25DCA1|nr:DUF262 domain-containing HNH endonuclease family protein [Pediococcus inopinatus]WPC18325.1 DUF262 domain-containing HNH endonuclease family protein [Pediococcus inopinatus]